MMSDRGFNLMLSTGSSFKFEGPPKGQHHSGILMKGQIIDPLKRILLISRIRVQSHGDDWNSSTIPFTSNRVNPVKTVLNEPMLVGFPQNTATIKVSSLLTERKESELISRDGNIDKGHPPISPLLDRFQSLSIFLDMESIEGKRQPGCQLPQPYMIPIDLPEILVTRTPKIKTEKCILDHCLKTLREMH